MTTNAATVNCITCGDEGGCPDCDPIATHPNLIRRCEDCGTVITTGKSIHYCRLDCEFRAHFDGNLICIKRSYLDANDALNNYVYDLIANGLLPAPLGVEEAIYELDTAQAAARHDDGLTYVRELRKAA
jgi:hypothetical protein